MKNKGIYLAILNQGNVRPELSELMMILARQEKYNLIINYPAKKPITNNRNSIVKRFLETDDMDYLLMIDNDCIPTENLLDLADYDKDIMGAVCFGYLKHMIVPFVMKKKDDGKYNMLDIDQGSGVVECDALGSGVMMIARRVLEDMPFPFRNEYDPEGIKTKGLDFNFCKRAKEMGYKVWVDTDMLVSHWTTMDLKETWLMISRIKDQVTKEKEKRTEAELALETTLEKLKKNDKDTI